MLEDQQIVKQIWLFDMSELLFHDFNAVEGAIEEDPMLVHYNKLMAIKCLE